MDAEGFVGIRSLADGSEQPVGLAREGSVLVTPVANDYVELVRRGRVYVACTGAAGVAPGTALSTTPPFQLWNPPGSNKVLVPIRVRVGYVSGTLGAGTIVLAGAAQAGTPSGGTELNPVRADFVASHGVGRAFQGSTLSTTPTLIQPVAIVGAALATSVFFPQICTDDLDGALCVPPGNVLCLQEIGAAGTSPLVLLSLGWAELDYP